MLFCFYFTLCLEPAHTQPGCGEDCGEAPHGAGEVFPADRVPGAPHPSHPHQGAHRHQPPAQEQEEPRVLRPRRPVTCLHTQVRQHLQRCLQRSW